MLKCWNKKGQMKIYTGYAKNAAERFEKHKAGTGAKFTRGKRLELAYVEEHATKRKAMQREIFIKKHLSRSQKLKMISMFQDDRV